MSTASIPKELVEILREIISFGDEESLERLQQMVRAVAENPPQTPRQLFIDLPWLLTALPELVNGMVQHHLA